MALATCFNMPYSYLYFITNKFSMASGNIQLIRFIDIPLNFANDIY